jgi:WD40 repeat protein
MNLRLASLAVLGLLAGADAHVPSASRTTKTGADGVVARAPAIPTSTLVSDFKKNNVSSSWAKGHPKVWGAEAVKFKGPLFVDVSADEKFAALVIGTNLTIRALDTQAVVSSAKIEFLGNADSVSILAARDGGGGYNVFVGSTNYTTHDVVTHLRLSAEGTFKGEQTQYKGSFSSFDGRRGPFSADGRWFIVLSGTGSQNNQAVIHEIDDPAANLTLVGHTDSIMSAVFSPDGSLVSTAAWDGSGKVWNATTGELLHTFGPSGGQDWITTFSPDGRWVSVANAGRQAAVNIWPVDDFSAKPITIDNFGNWVRTASWTSDSKLFAAGSYGVVQVYSMEEKRVVQRWEMEDHVNYETWDLVWIEAESGLKLAYRTTAGLEVYDFEANLKYRWGPDDFAQYDGGGSGDGTFAIKSKGWIGGADADLSVRFYEFPI